MSLNLKICHILCYSEFYTVLGTLVSLQLIFAYICAYHTSIAVGTDLRRRIHWWLP